MKRLTTYSMKGVAATLDGIPIIGFFDGDDVVAVDKIEDVGEWLIGADGGGLFNQSADDAVTITLKLMHTSPAHTQLIQKAQQQKAGSLIPFPFDVIDVNAPEGVNAGNCMVVKEPTKNWGKKATVREWVLASPDWSPI